MTNPSNKDGLTVVSLFSGAGGLDIAACNTGNVCDLFSTDSNELFLGTLRVNLPRHFPKIKHQCLVADAHQLRGDEIRISLRSQPDILIGGPPCEDFTTFGKKRGEKGKKAPLVLEYARLLNELRPRAFIFENVPNLNKQFKKYFNRILRNFSEADYRYQWACLKAYEFGAPTMRERIFVVGFLEKSLMDSFSFPQPTHTKDITQLPLLDSPTILRPCVTVGQVLSNLPDVGDPEARRFINHSGRNHRPSTIEHLKTIPQGVAVHKSYRYRASWDGLCRSLTAGGDEGSKAYIHPHYHREMTVREYARIHGFPDTWEFAGSFDRGLKQVANAVPIQMGTAVLNRLTSVLLE